MSEKEILEETSSKETTEETSSKETTEETSSKETTEETSSKETTKKVVNKNTKESFDWYNYEEGIDTVNEKELEKFDKLIDESIINDNDDRIVTGTVIDITNKNVIIDIKSKSEGFISLNEFRGNPDLKIGDKIDVFIKEREDSTGQLVLSYKKAKVIKAWNKINELYETGEIVSGFIKCRTKGGMIVDVLGIEVFLPGSQIDVKPILNYDIYINKTMDFKVVKVNHDFKNVVISHKVIVEADLEKQRLKTIKSLEKGQILEGQVKNITTYGIFVDLGGNVDGLIHITDLSWSRISHPSEIVEIGDIIKVVILDFEEDKTKIQLGMKQLTPHPWDKLDDKLKEGDKIKGKVSIISDYGAFIEVQEGIEGLIHVSEMSWSTHLRSAQDFMKVGEEVEAIILGIDKESRKISLGIKQLAPDPWKDITKKYPVGTKQKGVVRSFAVFGVFIELENGIDGLVYISDLSWTKKIKHPSNFLNVGDTIDVIVLEVDTENRRLSLGHKQTQKNPWEEYEKIFENGTIHTGKVIKFFDNKGATISFNEDVKAFVILRDLEKEDGKMLTKGEEAKFKILELNKDLKQVRASHSSIFKSQNKDNMKKIVKNFKKNTLGDIDALSNLKKENKKDDEKKISNPKK